MKIKWKKKLKRGPESSFKAVYCIELNKTYESLAEASRNTGANRSSIRDNINGKLGRVKGYPYKNRYLKCLIVENI